MDIKLLVTDLDGTLLIGNNKISKKNKLAVNKILQKNIKFIIATGRGPTRIKKIYNNLKLESYNLPIICYNGAAIYDYKKNIFTHKFLIEKEIARKIFEIANKLKISLWGFSDSNEEVYYTNKISFTRTVAMKIYKLKKNKFDLNTFNSNILKFSFLCSKNKFYLFKMEIEKFNLKIFETIFHLTNTKIWDITNINTDKYNAIQLFIKDTDIKDENIIAIGDGENDFTMIQNVELGIAMGNAIPKVKDIANYITETAFSNGFAKAMNKFI